MTKRQWRFHAIGFLAGLSVACSAGLCWAQSPGADPNQTRARELFEEGRQLADQAKWSEACPKFQQANDLYSTGGTMLQLANCYEQVGELRKAHELYLAIVNKGDEKYPERVKIAKERADDLQERLKAEAATAPAPDKPRPTGPSTPTPATGKQTPMTGEPAAQTPPDGAPSRVPAVIAFSAGGAGLAVGAIFGGLALSQHAAVVDKCTGGVCPTSQKPEADAAVTKAWVSNVGFAVGAVGVAVGVVLLAVQGRKASTGKPAAAHMIGPGFRPQPGGFSVRF